MSDLQCALVNGEKEDPTPKSMKKNREYYFSNIGSCTTTTNASPRATPKKGKSPADRGAQYSSSAPVEVPEWSKTNGNKWANTDFNENDDDIGGEMIPPHDYIAKRLAKAKISSFSMCEGSGRTLKGRDLRRVRNEVLTKTGFLE